MPRLRRSAAMIRDFGKAHFIALIHGHEFFNCFAENMEAKREAWLAMEDELLPVFVAACPAQRPWAWWQFSAPGGRILLPGPGNPRYHDPDAPRKFGYAELPNAEVVETQPEFLIRHGLLANIERAYLDGLTDRFYEKDFNFLAWWERRQREVV